MKKFIFLIQFYLLSIVGFSQINLAADVVLGSLSSHPKALTSFNSRLYFTTGLSYQQMKFWELYNGNLTQVSFPYTDTLYGKFNSTKYAIANNQLFIPAPRTKHIGDTLSPWKLSASGVLSEIADSIFISPSSNTTSNGAKVYFVGGNWGINPWWKGIYSYDFANNSFQRHGTKLDDVAISTGDTLSSISHLIYYDNEVFFAGRVRPASRWLLFKLDLMTNVITAFPNLQGPAHLQVGDDNKLYFTAHTLNNGRELFVIQGNNSPAQITSLNSTQDGVYDFIKWGAAIYFSGNDGVSGFELMKLDIATNQITLVKDAHPGGMYDGSYPDHLLIYGNKLYYQAFSVGNGIELWESDGTSSGTKMVMDLNPGTGSSNPSEFEIHNNQLYFQADGGTTGTELYRFSDPASIQSVSDVTSIKLFPNPSKQYVTIEFDLMKTMSGTIEIYDALGKVVYKSPVSFWNSGQNRITIPVESFSQGLYNYKLNSSEQKFLASGTFVKE